MKLGIRMKSKSHQLLLKVNRQFKALVIAFVALTACANSSYIYSQDIDIDPGIQIDPDQPTLEDVRDLLDVLLDEAQEQLDDMNQDQCDAYEDAWNQWGEETAEQVWDALEESFEEDREELESIEERLENAIEQIDQAIEDANTV